MLLLCLQNRFTEPEYSIALRILSYYFIFFPSLDVMSAFPLMVHCMVNNTYLILTGRDTSENPRWRFDWLFRFSLRFVLAVLPLLAAMGIANLIYILKYAGLFGFAIAVFFPAALQLASIYTCNKDFGVSRSAPSEKSPLIQNEDSLKLKFHRAISRLGVFEFRRVKRSHFVTPYSMGYLSHPLFVVGVIFVGICLFILACTSLAITPEKQSC